MFCGAKLSLCFPFCAKENSHPNSFIIALINRVVNAIFRLFRKKGQSSAKRQACSELYVLVFNKHQIIVGQILQKCFVNANAYFFASNTLLFLPCLLPQTQQIGNARKYRAKNTPPSTRHAIPIQSRCAYSDNRLAFLPHL